MGVAVPPGDVAADHPALLLVTVVVGAVNAEVAKRGELRLDAVEPARIEGDVGELDVVGGCPVADAGVSFGGAVRAPVVEHDRDSYPGRVQRAQVATEGQELAAALAGFDVAVEPVGRQVVGTQQVTHAVGTAVGRSSAAPMTACAAAGEGPLLARMRL